MLEIVSSVLQTDMRSKSVEISLKLSMSLSNVYMQIQQHLFSINGLTNKPCVSILSIFNCNQAKLSIRAYIPNRNKSKNKVPPKLNIYSGRTNYNAVLNYSASMDFRQFPYGKLRNSDFFKQHQYTGYFKKHIFLKALKVAFFQNFFLFFIFYPQQEGPQ